MVLSNLRLTFTHIDGTPDTPSPARFWDQPWEEERACCSGGSLLSPRDRVSRLVERARRQPAAGLSL